MVLPAAATWLRRPAFRQLLLIACCTVMAACGVAATSSQGGSDAAVQEHQLSALQRSMLAVRPLLHCRHTGVCV